MLSGGNDLRILIEADCCQDAGDNRQDQAHLLADQVDQEHVVVVEANAVVDPGAVVVVPVHALVADDAVPRPACPDDFAVGAQRLRIKCFQKLHKLNALVLNEARVSNGEQKMQKQRNRVDAEACECEDAVQARKQGCELCDVDEQEQNVEDSHSCSLLSYLFDRGVRSHYFERLRGRSQDALCLFLQVIRLDLVTEE